MQELTAYIEARVTMPASDLATVLSRFETRTVKKGQRILRSGQIANQYYYIRRGSLRLYYGEQADEHTSWAFFENDFFAEISSLSPQVPTRFNIEAVQDTDLAMISKADMDKLYRQFPLWQEFGRKLWEEMCVRQVDQNLSYQTLSAKELYRQLLQHPHFVREMPVKQLATILGITPNALSRIRKEL